MQPGMACCQLLAVILLTDEVAEPRLLWDQFKAGVREPNSMPELSQLLFVQRLTKRTR